MQKIVRFGSLALACLLPLHSGVTHSSSSLMDRQVDLDMPAQSASSALIQLSKAANVQIIMTGRALDGYAAPSIHGRMSLGGALSRILQLAPHKVQPAHDNTITVEVPQVTK